MERFEPIWTFNTARFSIIVDWTYEPDPDLSFDESGETQDMVASGEWVCMLVRARVLCDGREIGSDYLGNSIYADPSDFRDHVGIKAKSRADGCNYGSCFSDMVRSAIEEARTTLCTAPRVRCAA